MAKIDAPMSISASVMASFSHSLFRRSFLDAYICSEIASVEGQTMLHYRNTNFVNRFSTHTVSFYIQEYLEYQPKTTGLLHRLRGLNDFWTLLKQLLRSCVEYHFWQQYCIFIFDTYFEAFSFQFIGKMIWNVLNIAPCRWSNRCRCHCQTYRLFISC